MSLPGAVGAKSREAIASGYGNTWRTIARRRSQSRDDELAALRAAHSAEQLSPKTPERDGTLMSPARPPDSSVLSAKRNSFKNMKKTSGGLLSRSLVSDEPELPSYLTQRVDSEDKSDNDDSDS